MTVRPAAVGRPQLLEAAARREAISCCPLRIEHQSLCSATGIPHSMQMRTRPVVGYTRLAWAAMRRWRAGEKTRSRVVST